MTFRLDRFTWSPLDILEDEPVAKAFAEEAHPRDAQGQWAATAEKKKTGPVVTIDLDDLVDEMASWHSKALDYTDRLVAKTLELSSQGINSDDKRIKRLTDARFSLMTTMAAAKLLKEAPVKAADRTEVYTVRSEGGEIEAAVVLMTPDYDRHIWAMAYLATAPWNNHYVGDLLNEKVDREPARALGIQIAKIAIERKVDLAFTPATPDVAQLYGLLGAKYKYKLAKGEWFGEMIWDQDSMRTFVSRYDKSRSELVFDEPIIAVPAGYIEKGIYVEEEHPRDAKGKFAKKGERAHNPLSFGKGDEQDDTERIQEYISGFSNWVWSAGTREEHEAADSYKGAGFWGVNMTLRSDFDPEEVAARLKRDGIKSTDDIGANDRAKKIFALDRMIARSELPDDVKVYRYTDNAHLPQGNLAGGVLQDKAFLSTTLSRYLAEVHVWSEEHALIEIRLPKGYNALGFARSAFRDGEYELLLPRNEKLRVIEDKQYRLPGYRSGKSVRYLIVEPAEG